MKRIVELYQGRIMVESEDGKGSTFAIYLSVNDKESPNYKMVYSFIEDECPELYFDILDMISGSEAQQNYMFKNFVTFFGRKGVSDLLAHLEKVDYDIDKQLIKWDAIAQKEGIGYVDFELIRVYRRFIDLDILPEKDHKTAQQYIKGMSMLELAFVLESYIGDFEKKLLSVIDKEKGRHILRNASKIITNNIQLKLENFLGEKNNG